MSAFCMLRATVLAALVTILFSCASDETTYRVDPGTTDAEYSYAADAMARLNVYTTEDATLRLRDDGAWRITFTDDPRVISHGIDGRTCGRHADPDNDCRFSHWIRIRRGFSAERTTALIEHELGHSLGLEHVRDRASVMHERTGGIDLTPIDVEEGQRAGAFAMVIGRVQ